MFVDIWVFLLFAGLFGYCAVWNFNAGLRRGITGTLEILEREKIIKLDGDNVVPYSRNN